MIITLLVKVEIIHFELFTANYALYVIYTKMFIVYERI